MSAYIVSIETMHRVVSAVRDWCDAQETRCGEPCPALLSHPEKLLPGKVRPMRQGNTEATLLGQMLFEMNQRAVRARYGSRGDEYEVIPFYEFRRDPVSNVRAYKSIQNLLYQCTEGDVDQEPLYQALTRFADMLARRIVMDLPEYESSEWS